MKKKRKNEKKNVIAVSTANVVTKWPHKSVGATPDKPRKGPHSNLWGNMIQKICPHRPIAENHLGIAPAIEWLPAVYYGSWN